MAILRAAVRAALRCCGEAIAERSVRHANAPSKAAQRERGLAQFAAAGSCGIFTLFARSTPAAAFFGMSGGLVCKES